MIRFLSLRRPRKAVAPARKPRSRRPVLERLEDRALPSITFSGPGNTGDATITGTAGPDRFVIRLDPSDATMIQLSDDGGATFTTAALADITSITVNGLAGNDRLTIDNGNGLVASTAGLPITFDGGTGSDALKLVGDPGVANVDETYTVGSTPDSGKIETTDGTVTQTIDFSHLTVIVDTTVADSLTVNLNDDPNMVFLQEGPTINHAKTLRIAGTKAENDNGADDDEDDEDEADRHHQSGGADDQGDDNDQGDQNNQDDDDSGDDDDLAGDQDNNVDENANQPFVPILVANKTDVTVNTLGGDDFVLLNHPNRVTGLDTLTIDGGDGQDTVALKHPPAGATVNILNVEKTVVNPNEMQVEDLFEKRLSRPASPADMAFWGNALARAGMSAVAQAIDNSTEAHAVQVRQLYQHYLNRAADTNGLGYFTSLLNRGAHEETVICDLLGSQEFLTNAEAQFPGVSPNEAFIRGLYQFALNRAPSSSEVSFWMQQLPTDATAEDRCKVATQFLLSREFRTDVIMALYNDLLRRQADTGGIAFFVSKGGDLRTIRQTLLASAEFAAKH